VPSTFNSWKCLLFLWLEKYQYFWSYNEVNFKFIRERVIKLKSSEHLCKHLCLYARVCIHIIWYAYNSEVIHSSYRSGSYFCLFWSFFIYSSWHVSEDKIIDQITSVLILFFSITVQLLLIIYFSK